MAIEDLDPRYGRIVAKHIVMYDGIKADVTELDLFSCNDIYDEEWKKVDYLCLGEFPQLEGIYESEKFSYV